MSESRPPVAALLSVGNELLYGETVDTNAAWLGKSLALLGIPVVRKFTVGDVTEEIQGGLRRAMEGADLVLVSGGLGPTSDDLTKEAVSELLGRPLHLDEALLESLKARFLSRGFKELPAPNRSQAEVPEGATVLGNPQGTAPGLALETESCAVVMLPGVPRELRAIFEGDLLEWIRRRFADRLKPVHHRVIHTTGVAESRLAELLEPALPRDMGPVTLAYLPDLLGVDLRLSASGVSESEALRWFDRIGETIGPVVRRWRFEAASGDVAEALSTELLRTHRKLAVAESCTGGLLAKRVTDLPGSSNVFVGGVVAYDNAVKVAELGVSADDIAREGAVSETVARQLARGVKARLGADAGIGVTGVAGPGGGTPDKPVGTVWIAVAVDDAAETQLVHLVGDRRAIRERAAQVALSLLLRLLQRVGSGA
jgi:competence/damage-inducible protein CinA-like protein